MQYIQTYFECLRDAGINTTLQINRMRGTNCIETIKFDHVNHDGVSIMTELARNFPAEGFEAPKLFVKPKPSLIKRLYELFRWYVRFYPFLPPKWKEIRKDQTVAANGMVQIENWNRAHPTVSINTKLLFALDQTSHDLITKPDVPRVWMTPVGIYAGVTRDTTPLNRVSFIDIKIKKNESLESVQNSVRQQLADLNYWGTILTMYLTKVLGKFLFTKYAVVGHLTFRRTGTFTNLGEWKIPSLPQDEWWSFGQFCVAKMTPVAGTAIVLNGRLGLSVHFHPSIGLTPTEAQQFVENWKANFLKL